MDSACGGDGLAQASCQPVRLHDHGNLLATSEDFLPFDLRVLIGGLFLVYGVMLTVAGFLTSSKDLAKASQININLWMGLGMLVIAVFFLAWWRLRPLRRDQPPPDAAGTGP